MCTATRAPGVSFARTRAPTVRVIAPTLEYPAPVAKLNPYDTTTPDRFVARRERTSDGPPTGSKVAATGAGTAAAPATQVAPLASTRARRAGLEVP
jgi:hypothetical protein